MNNPLYLFVGKSASGKTTVADALEEKYGLKQTSSYTTRPPRYDGEIAHIFITDEEFDALENIVAYTEYNGFRYAATSEQIDNVSIYVVDIPGTEMLLEKYLTERPIVMIYFDASVRTRIDRMIDRHDPDVSIVSRLYNDESSDWLQELNKLAWHYQHNVGKNVEVHSIDANHHLENVLKQIGEYINFNEAEHCNGFSPIQSNGGGNI